MSHELDDAFKRLSASAKPRRGPSRTRVSAGHNGLAINARGNVTVVSSGGAGSPRRPFLIVGFGRVAGFFILLFFGGLMAYWVLPVWHELGGAGGGLPVALWHSLPSVGVLVASFFACTVAGFAAAGALYWLIRHRPD